MIYATCELMVLHYVVNSHKMEKVLVRLWVPAPIPIRHGTVSFRTEQTLYRYSIELVPLNRLNLLFVVVVCSGLHTPCYTTHLLYSVISHHRDHSGSSSTYRHHQNHRHFSTIIRPSQAGVCCSPNHQGSWH